MKFVDGIKFGASFYLGWTLMKSLDRALGKTKPVQEMVRKTEAMREKSEPKQKEEQIIGFHM